MYDHVRLIQCTVLVDPSNYRVERFAPYTSLQSVCISANCTLPIKESSLYPRLHKLLANHDSLFTVMLSESSI